MPLSLTPGMTLSGSWRDLPWLTEERLRIYGIALAVALAGACCMLIWSLQAGYDSKGQLFGADFSSFWAASRLALAGQPADVYNPVLHRLAELPVLRDSYEAFYYPPTYLLVCLPLGLLPFFAALIVFLVATGAAFASVIASIIGRYWAVIAVPAFSAAYANIIPGQNAFLTASLLGSGLLILDRRPRLAGALLGLMVIKPHLALAVPVALVHSRRWTVLLSAALSAAAMIAVSWMVFGSGTWAAFLANASQAGETLEHGLVGFAKMQSAFALARLGGLPVPAAYVVQALAALAAIAGLLWAQRRGADALTERSLIVIACLLITPFSLFYDMVILALPLAWMACAWQRRGFPGWSKPVMGIAFAASSIDLLLRPLSFGCPVLLLFGAVILSSMPQRPERNHSATDLR